MSADISDGNAAAREAEELEDQLDIALVKLARVEQANEETVPFEVVRRLSDGEVPVAVWREHRGLSRSDLASAAGVGVDVVEAVESGKEDVPLRIMQVFARALRVDLDDLVPWVGADEVGPA
jgi:DNA-binding XRE family transcriptional regulator|nr:helix-turn-helix transcriptional regulator [uncultured Rhodopila sp.]